MLCDKCLIKKHCGSDLSMFKCKNFKPNNDINCSTCKFDNACRREQLEFDCIYFERKEEVK